MALSWGVEDYNNNLDGDFEDIDEAYEHGVTSSSLMLLWTQILYRLVLITLTLMWLVYDYICCYIYRIYYLLASKYVYMLNFLCTLCFVLRIGLMPCASLHVTQVVILCIVFNMILNHEFSYLMLICNWQWDHLEQKGVRKTVHKFCLVRKSTNTYYSVEVISRY